MTVLTKKEHISYWVSSSNENWETALYLLEGKQYLMCLFTFHLVVEKLLKAHWIKDNVANTPPRTHDLQLIYQQTELELTGELYDYLGGISNWNIQSRYPDYKMKLHKICTPAYMELQKTKMLELRKCLLEKL